MQPNQQNSIKNYAYRLTAVIIVLCYILGPAHIQINSILHTISHNLTAPSFVLQHNHEDNYAYVNSEVQTTSYNKEHQHEFLDFFNTVFDKKSNKDNNHKGESTTIKLKINKHITSNKYVLVFNENYSIETPVFWTAKVFSIKGFLNELYRPPKA